MLWEKKSSKSALKLSVISSLIGLFFPFHFLYLADSHSTLNIQVRCQFSMKSFSEDHEDLVLPKYSPKVSLLKCWYAFTEDP